MTRLLPEEISTSRLRLRCSVLADAHAIFEAYAQDPEVCRFMTWTPHASEAVTQAFIESCIEAWREGYRLPYVVTDIDSDAAIGMLEARIQGTTVDIGYVLARPHWGHGLIPEAIRALTTQALTTPGVYRVQATCDSENIQSQRALEKSGFLREGRLERLTIHPNISAEPRAGFLYAKCR
jgi:RimJ/RimL family protein N-acetyltransferase